MSKPKTINDIHKIENISQYGLLRVYRDLYKVLGVKFELPYSSEIKSTELVKFL